MTQPLFTSVGPIDAGNDDSVCESQTPLAGGPLTLDGVAVNDGVATFDAPRRVLITTTGDESGRVFVITGTLWNGQVFSESITGIASGTAVATNQSFATVTEVTVDDATAGAIIVGTNGVADSPWLRLDDYAPSPIAVTVVVDGTVNYDVEISQDDPDSFISPVPIGEMVWLNALDANLVNQSANKTGGITFTPCWVRLTLNSGSGSARMTVVQSGTIPK
jgi:hypothetical protein